MNLCSQCHINNTSSRYMLSTTRIDINNIISLAVTTTPLSPKEFLINLLCINEMFQLMETRKCSELKSFPCHINPFKQSMQLICPQ